jgi:hypothetical protein
LQQHTNTSPLDQTEINRFRNEGYLFLKNSISPGMLSGLKWQFEQWLEQSREFNISFGEQSDGRSRISLESSHNAMQPAIRRIASPRELQIFTWK